MPRMGIASARLLRGRHCEDAGVDWLSAHHMTGDSSNHASILGWRQRRAIISTPLTGCPAPAQ